ncbi:cytochrome c3 family protein [Geomonas anaerohicana]|uniref:Cytochrome C n=1 Tax=Geomonas anaerohicana TaxID=2798583 RepID=A0ABS0YGZ6_9BACT|nr:cytochrome c3 family protein [Geomonas anaerohicana]MBJ6751533.1 cytochrome C [Geomonas anaerohicana]
MRIILSRILVLVVAVLTLAGCEPAARQRFLTTFFDEVPVLPPVEEYCAEAAVKNTVQTSAGKPVAVVKPEYKPSSHPPYEEKRCNGCHEAEKTTISGLIRPRNELCFLCHPRILKHRFAHGPAAEGDCLACHFPHEGSYPSLLLLEPERLCDKCHLEARAAAGMHAKIEANGVRCIDCHDPHSGDSRYFLK